MSWLDELNKSRLFVYRNASNPEDEIIGNTETLQGLSGISDLDPNPGTKFEFEGQTFEYAGMVPANIGMMSKVVFEKNGRKAVRTQFGDGQQVVRSATKEAYYKGKGSDSVLTKGCKEASEKAKQNIIQGRAEMLAHELRREAYELKQRGKKR